MRGKNFCSSKYIMSNDLLRILIIAAVAYVAYNVLIKDGSLIKNDGVLQSEMGQGETSAEHSAEHSAEGVQESVDKKVANNQIDDVYNGNNTNVLPLPQMSNNFAPQGNFEPGSNFAQLDCFPGDQLVAQDLLPTEGGFAESNPAGQGQLMNRNLFESGHHAGLNTQSNSLRNGNRQLRTDPLIVRRDVGPWHQSTYEADTNRRTFEIGMV